MQIVLMCATRRGYLFLERLGQLLPEGICTVFSFRETPWEPPFMNDIRELTLSRGGQFIEATRVAGPELDQFWESTAVDILFAVSWRYMIPSRIYNRARLGAFVFHDSLLPEYRGFSPTVWAVANGEDHTGVTLFEIAEDVDSGAIVDQKRVSIGADDDIAFVMERVTQTYLDLLERNLPALVAGKAERHPQDHSKATYACKRLPEDNEIDWTAPSAAIHNLVRAVTAPYPGAFTYLGGKKMRVWSARRLANAHRYVGGVPGRVVEVKPGEGSVVLAGDGPLLLTKIELETGGIVCAADILNSLNQTLGA
jgi:methionyl-tRNA formyltransferase